MSSDTPDRTRVDRRVFLVTGLGALTSACAGRAPGVLTRQLNTPNPFTLGVASGEPDHESVVLWTRLAPQPLAEDGLGGMPRRSVTVKWEMALDEGFRRIVRRGEAEAVPDEAHTLHIVAEGLRPAVRYFYRFIADGHMSASGKTRTAPAPNAPVPSLRFAFASCARWDDGYFTAYRHLADEQPDLVLHLGDYLYEYAPKANRVRGPEGPETVTLAQYRVRHALYKTDRDLQRAHAAAPWLVVGDDHEVDNNYAGDVPEDTQTPEAFLARRAAAYRAYYEMMPLRPAARPAGPRMHLHRAVSWGQLAEFYMLDTRQYRSDQACGDGVRVECAERLDARRTMLGASQEEWLLARASRSRARWDVLGQQVFMGKLDRGDEQGEAYSMDQWSGYAAARDRLLQGLTATPRNLVVLTGDIHTHYADDLTWDYVRPDSRIIGSELVGTSIASGGDGIEQAPLAGRLLRRNPHLRFINGRRGYVTCAVSPTEWRAHFRVVPYVARPGAPLETRASFVIEAGKPGLQRA